MISLIEQEQRPSSSRWRRIVVLIVVVSLVVSGVGWLWHRHGRHNVFDAIMEAEWTVSTSAATNPALSDKYRGVFSYGGGDPVNHKQWLQYWSRTDMVSVSIRPDHDKTDCSELGCTTTPWKSMVPTELEVFYTERITDELLYAICLVYDRHKHSMHQQVVVYRDDLLSDDVAAAVFAEHGITGDYLRQKRDWLLYEKFLPDFLAANPGIMYTVHNWGRVTVTADHFLTS